MAKSILLMLAVLSTGQLGRIASAQEGFPWTFLGRYFVFSFPYPHTASSVRPHLIATAQTPDEQTEVRFEIPALGCSQQTQIGHREVALFDLPREKTRGSSHDELGSQPGLYVKRTNDTVIVRASHKITLQCVTSHRADRFLVFPSGDLGVEYFVASSPVARRHQFTVSTTRDHTRVNITARFPLLVNGAGVKTDHIELTLDGYSTSIHVSSLTDLTGVRVTSNHPVSVVSGSQLGENVLAQQLTPVEKWGRTFILARSGYLASSVPIYRIVAPRPNTTLSISSSSVAIDARTGDTEVTWYDHSVQTERGFDTLSSDKAVMVIRYTLATALLITPVELYTSDDSFEFMNSELVPESVSFVLNVAYLCGQGENLSIHVGGNLRPFRDTSLSSINEAFCVRTLAFRQKSGGDRDGVDQTMCIRGQGNTAPFVWVDTVDGAEIAESYRVAAAMQPYQPANQSGDSCTVTDTSQGTTTPFFEAVVTSRQPTRTGRPNRSDAAVVIVPLCVSVAVVLAIIVGLCCFMKKNKMFPVCPSQRRRAYDISNAVPASQLTRREAAPSPEVIPLQNRYSVSLPDLRPITASRERYPSGQQARFLHVRPLSPITEDEVNAGAPANCRDARVDVGRHNTFQQQPVVRHTYFSLSQQTVVDHQPPPRLDPTDQVRQPPPRVIPGRNAGNMPTTDRSATGHFASIGRRQPSSAKPIPVQLIFQKPGNTKPIKGNI